MAAIRHPEMESGTQKPRIQITGFKNQEKKSLVELLLKLDCVFFDTEQYRNCTHLIAKKPCKSEKFLAACAAGKWILTKDYIINSAESGRWLDETTYEWGYKIETSSHYSPQMQSAPKRWREELTRSGATGAFHRWKVVLLVAKGDKRRDSLTRLLEAGKATICSILSTAKNITHVLTNNTALNQEREKCLFGAPYYPVRYIGSYLLENEIQSNNEKCMNHLEPQHEARDMSGINLGEMKNNLLKHMYLQQAMLSKYTQIGHVNEFTQEVKNTCSSGRINHVLEELVDDHLFPIAITEFHSGKDLIPPIKFLHSLLEHILQGGTDPALPVNFFQIMYALLEHDPPWKSTSMLRYYLEVLQCPVCKKGMWPLIQMLVRSCLFCSSICHSENVTSENVNEKRIFHKRLLMFILNLFKAEVLALTRSVCEAVDSQAQQVLPQTVLQKTFWTESESVFFTKQINILVDWIIHSYREKYKKKDIFKHDVADLLNGILGAVVDYWILSGFIMDRNILYPIANDLASYIAISCDDFSTKELKMFISSIPSQWLEMFVAEAFFKNASFQSNTIISTELLSLQKIVCSYLPALQEGMHETGKMQKAKKKKIGQWRCPESQRALLMLNGDKQNQAEVLPDVPISKRTCAVRKLEDKAEVVMLHSKENWHSSANRSSANIYKVNFKGETSLHIACKRNNVKRLIHLLSVPGIDINIKDYAGWTPLHEACNHGSTVCVREILQHCPEVDLLSQVDGVTPLHDALSNGHIEVAKLLLQHGGPLLLQMKDSEGKLPLDYIDCITTKQCLLHVVKPEETIENFRAQVEKKLYNQQAEFWTDLVCKMLLNFCSVFNLFTPLSVTFKKLTCSNPLLETAGSKFNINSPTHWFIDLYCRELKTFQNLPGYLQKTIEELKKFPGEEMQAFVATLQQISIAIQMSCLDLSNSFQANPTSLDPVV